MASGLEELPDDVLEIVRDFVDTGTVQDSLNWNAVCRRLRDLRRRRHVVQAEGGAHREVEVEVYGGREYVSLTGDNYSSYKIPTRGGWSKDDSDVLTKWYKIGVDLNTMLVNTGDFKFTTSTGRQSHDGRNPHYIPYATCRGCEAPGSKDARARIDLRGTFLAVADKFQHAGCESAGSWIFSENDQVVDLEGGGYCGWTCPALVTYEDEYRPLGSGGWHLRVKVLPE